MISRKEALRQKLANKLQAKREKEESRNVGRDKLVNAVGVTLSESGSRQLRLKVDRPAGITVISSEVKGIETGKLSDLLGDMDSCRRTYNRLEDSTKRLILACAYRIMESHILSDQIADDDVCLDPSYPLEDYLSIARSLSIHRRMLCEFARKAVTGNIPEVKEGDGVDKVRDLIIHELRICTVIHEMIDEEGPVPTIRQALEWRVRWDVIFRRINGALKVMKPLCLEVLHDDPNELNADEPFDSVPVLVSVKYEHVLSIEGYLRDWARNARFPKTDFDAEGTRKSMRAQWDRFVSEED
jgi:hypothetical protein